MNKPDTQIVQQSAAQMVALPTTGQGEFLLYQTGELQEAATCKPYLQVRQERAG